MNIAPSDLPRLAGAASLSKPGFDIVLAMSGLRQSASPTARMADAQANRIAHRKRINMLCHFLSGERDLPERTAGRPVRFFDLSDPSNSSPETMNSLFTRGFQSVLSPSDLDREASVTPIPPDAETME